MLKHQNTFGGSTFLFFSVDPEGLGHASNPLSYDYMPDVHRRGLLRVACPRWGIEDAGQGVSGDGCVPVRHIMHKEFSRVND